MIDNQGSKRQKIIIPVFILLIMIGSYFGVKYYQSRELFTVMKAPDFTLTDQYHKTISNKEMLGKVYLVEFFFSQCPTICPVMNSNMRYIEQEIDNPDFGIISISIDPENDTPEVLQNHAKSIGVRSPNWHFLTGDRSYIGSIAEKFNIYVGKEKDKAESLNHSGMIALVDKQGNVRCRYDESGMPILYYSGLNYEDAAGKIPKLNGQYHPDRTLLIEDIKKLLNN